MCMLPLASKLSLLDRNRQASASNWAVKRVFSSAIGSESTLSSRSATSQQPIVASRTYPFSTTKQGRFQLVGIVIIFLNTSSSDVHTLAVISSAVVLAADPRSEDACCRPAPCLSGRANTRTSPLTFYSTIEAHLSASALSEQQWAIVISLSSPLVRAIHSAIRTRLPTSEWRSSKPTTSQTLPAPKR
jgi:hypothetical protein